MLEPSERLRNAIIQANLPITKRLVSRFPELWLNVDPSHDGWCNLHYASYHGNYLICFYLISFMNQKLGGLSNNYSYLDLLTFDELSVIHLSTVKHHSQTLHYLLQEFPGKIWLNFAGGPLKQTPLHYSCVHGFKEGVKLLLEFGADWRAQDRNGDTCLHLCFQYGQFTCMEELLKYLASKHRDSSSLKSSMQKYEEIPNKKGWLAVDYASDFDLINNFKSLKSDLLSSGFQFQDSIPIADLSSSNSSLLNLSAGVSEISLQENKVLSSPIVSMSHTQTLDSGPITPTGTKSPDYTNLPVKGRRPHSQSLPGAVPEGLIAKVKTATSSRNRSNTTYNLRPPNPIPASSFGSPRTAGLPQTPISSHSQRTPSIKSVTISPSVRKSDDDERYSNKVSYSDAESAAAESPVLTGFDSSSSNSPRLLAYTNSATTSAVPSSNISPIKTPTEAPNISAERRRSFSLSTQMNSLSIEENPWPVIINTSPNHVVAQSALDTKLAPLREAGSPSSSWDSISPSNSMNQPRSITQSPTQQQKEPPRSRRSSVSSLARLVPINSSRTSLNQLESPSRRRPSLSQKSSNGTSSAEESSPVIRKTRSSGTLPSAVNVLNQKSSATTLPPPQHVLQPPKSNGGLGNFSNDSTESLKRTNINSISFSRVR